jgi:hypothetical protein
VRPPYKVLVRAGHNVGKSFIAGCLVNWWYDCFDPGVCLTTAPKLKQVQDILWKEVRRQRAKSNHERGGFPGPKSARLESSEDHFAYGFTATSGDSFQGQHEAAVLIIFDEAEGVEPIFWEAAETMLGGAHYGFLGIYNPTSQSGPTVEAERSGQYHTFTMSALDHPNIRHDRLRLPGRPPVPNAIRLHRLREMMEKWSQRCDKNEPGAIELDGEWWNPGPIAEARLLGRRPSAGFRSVWPTWVFEKAIGLFIPFRETDFLQVGFDVGEMGDDPSSFCVRHGSNIVHLEEFHGPKDYTSGMRAADRAFDLTQLWATKLGKRPESVPIVVDCCGGYGNEPLNRLRQRGYMAIPFMGSWKANDEEQFPNMRSEVWVYFSRVAASGQLSLAHLSIREQEMLRVELTATEYEINLRGQMQCERKSETKKRIGRSPDNADAMLMACVNVGMIEEKIAGQLTAPGTV